MKRKPWIVAAVVLVVLIVLCVAGAVIARNAWKAPRGSTGHHELLAGLGYCSVRPAKPCILSFNLDPKGGMLIQVLTDSLQDFDIKIKHAEGESLYECKRTRPYSPSVICTGEALPAGETLSVSLISKEDHVTLAEGSFPMLGLALATPEVYFTPTPILFDHSPR